MSGNNTSVRPAATGRPVQIVPIWQSREWRLSLAEHPDGSVTLMRSGNYDDGPSRSCPIPAEGLAAVAAKLWAIAISRACRGLGQQMAQAYQEIMARRA